MYQRTPFRSQRLTEPLRDKENVKSTGLAAMVPGRARTPMKAFDSPHTPLTPLRQPLALVNGPGSGLKGQQPRKQSLKPSLPRIEALRNEGGIGKLDGGSATRGTKTPKRPKRHKSKSCTSTPSLASVTKPKPDDSVVDSITSHLFDQILQSELGLVKSKTTLLQPKLERSISPVKVRSLSDTVEDIQDGQDITEPWFDEAVSAYVEGIISSALHSLHQEAQMASHRTDSEVTTYNQTLKSPSSRPEPSDEDIQTYVDAVLSVQLQLVRMEYEDKLNSCLDHSLDSPHDASKDSLQDGSLTSFNDDGHEGALDADINDSLVGSLSFADTTPSRVKMQCASPCTSLLLDAFASLSEGGTPLCSSPGYMLLPPRRELVHGEAGVTLRHASADSLGSYEDEFLRFVHSQYSSKNAMERTNSPFMQDTGMCTTPGLNDVSRNSLSYEVRDTYTPLRLIDNSTNMTPKNIVNTETSITPVKLSDISTETNALSLQESSTETEAVQLQDAMIGSPLNVASVGVSMTPVKPSDAQTNTSPTKVTDSSTDMGIEMADCGSDARKLEVCDAMVGTPVKQCTSGVATSPVISKDTSSCMTPVKMDSTAMGTSPAKVEDCGTEMPVIHLMDTGVSMSPLPTRTETAVGTSPTATADKEVGCTPIRMTDMNCGTTPHQVTDSNTAMTPILVTNTQTLTSPPVVPNLRFSMSPNSVDSVKLVSHVQTAAISNQLLRTEIQMLRSEKAQADQRLTLATEQIQKKEQEVLMSEDSMGQLKRMARASADKEIEDVMSQVGEQMMQIAQLEAALGEKTQMLSSLKDDNEKMKKDYKQQIIDLQDDLCRAYRQHQQQLSDLETQYRKGDYERHYTRSQHRVNELETQLDAFIQLQDTVDRAIQIQDQFNVAKKTFEDVESLFKMTIQSRDRVTAQMKTLEDNKTSLEEEKEAWRHQIEDGERKMKESNEKMEEMRKMKEEAEKSRCEMHKELQETLQAKDTDISKKDKEIQELSSKCTHLEEREVAHFLEERNQEAAIIVQLEQQKAIKLELEQTKTNLQETIDQLHKQCQSVSTEKLSLSVDLNSTKAKLYSVEAELEDTKKMSEERRSRLSDLELELQTCRNAGTELQLVKSTLKTLEKQFQENKQFLEEERTALEESAAETENELRITGMELSRSKAALSEAELVRRQLQVSMSSLSEQVESLQSELDHTKAQAHWMLFNQASEISDATTALDQLTHGISTAVAKLTDHTLDKVEGSSSSGFVTEQRGHVHHRSKSSAKPGSLVVSVLRAVDHIETPGKTSGIDDPVTPCRQKGKEDGSPAVVIGQSSSSAFSVPRPRTATDHQEGEATGNDDQEKKAVEALPDQVLKLKTLFSKMFTAFIENEEKLREEVSRLQHEIQEKDKGSKKTLQRSESQMLLLREQLEESLSYRNQLQQSLVDAQRQSSEQLQALDYAQQRIEDMATNLARFSDQKSKIEAMEEEISGLRASLKMVTREKEIVMAQYEALSSKYQQVSMSSTGDGESMGKLLKENLHLKKELDKVRMKFLKRQEDYELFQSKAGKQMKVLEGNWKKAEAEIYRLDQLFDHCRKVMDKVPSQMCQKDPNLRLLYEMFSSQ
nr:myosin-2 heavy chain-like [Lytechinus pictus]XP_054748885.1 myosin-2 heavy chain-like [Lytechinus pictus]